MEKDPFKILLNYSFRLLGRKGYTQSELIFRLHRRVKKIKLTKTEVVIEQIIRRLTELNYLNDQRILDDYFEYSLPAKPQGRFAFIQEMRKRGIASSIAQPEWDKRSIDEKQLALELIHSRLLKLKSSMPLPAKKKKIANLLASRGFSPDVIWSILDSVIL